MTKHELVELTIEQLLYNFISCPECFELDKAESKSFNQPPNDAIMWKPKVDTGSGIVSDPNNPSRTVIIVNNRVSGTIQCFIYFKDMVNVHNANSHRADAQIESDVGFWKRLDSNHNKFQKLKKLIQGHNAARENNTFLGQLQSVFPGLWDDHIFGKK